MHQQEKTLLNQLKESVKTFNDLDIALQFYHYRLDDLTYWENFDNMVRIEESYITRAKKNFELMESINQYQIYKKYGVKIYEPRNI